MNTYEKVVLDGDMSLSIPLDGEMGLFTTIIQGELPYYTGAVEVTPSQETQVLQTAEHIVLNNIVVNPIPSNYGRISWNGAELTVS